jgi:RNA polymerase sigma-70 factor, ECF subfamily
MDFHVGALRVAARSRAIAELPIPEITRTTCSELQGKRFTGVVWRSPAKQTRRLPDQDVQMGSRPPDLAEFQRLYEDDFYKFVRVARAIVGDAQLALDAVHDGFAAGIRGRDGYRGEGPLAAWVWRAVVNAALKCRAARGEFLPLPDHDGSDPAREDAQTPRLLSAIAALPQRQRMIVFLRYYADLDYRGIAKALDIEVGTVSAALSAAHQSLRKALQEVTTHG